MVVPWWESLLRLAYAAGLGALIGWDRETQGKPAGLRTLTLVSLASATFVLGAQEASAQAGEALDSVRAMAGIAGGVGFLGAGAILQARGEVRWLTTAAALWAAAALGMAAGMGSYLTALFAGGLVYAVLRLSKWENRWAPRKERVEKPNKKVKTD